MPFVVLFIGFVLVVLGIYFVHHQSRATYWVKKVMSISTTMIGAGLIWAVAATYVPPAHQVETTVIGEFADGVVLKFKASNSRGCKLERVHAAFMLEDGKKLEVDAQVFLNKKTITDDFGYIIVSNPRHINAEKLSLDIKHFCPFGIEVKSELETIKLQGVNLNIPFQPQH